MSDDETPAPSARQRRINALHSVYALAASLDDDALALAHLAEVLDHNARLGSEAAALRECADALARYAGVLEEIMALTPEEKFGPGYEASQHAHRQHGKEGARDDPAR